MIIQKHEWRNHRRLSKLRSSHCTCNFYFWCDILHSILFFFYFCFKSSLFHRAPLLVFHYISHKNFESQFCNMNNQTMEYSLSFSPSLSIKGLESCYTKNAKCTIYIIATYITCTIVQRIFDGTCLHENPDKCSINNHLNIN